MSTPAEILVSLSGLPSGTPAEHLLAVTGGTPGTGETVYIDSIRAEVTPDLDAIVVDDLAATISDEIDASIDDGDFVADLDDSIEGDIEP